MPCKPGKSAAKTMLGISSSSPSAVSAFSFLISSSLPRQSDKSDKSGITQDGDENGDQSAAIKSTRGSNIRCGKEGGGENLVSVSELLVHLRVFVSL